MKIYNPFNNESYDSKFSPKKLIEKCSQSTHFSNNEDVYFDLKKLVFIIKTRNSINIWIISEYSHLFI